MQLLSVLSTVSLTLAVLALHANAAIPGAGLADATGRSLCGWNNLKWNGGGLYRFSDTTLNFRAVAENPPFLSGPERKPLDKSKHVPHDNEARSHFQGQASNPSFESVIGFDRGTHLHASGPSTPCNALLQTNISVLDIQTRASFHLSDAIGQRGLCSTLSSKA
ncbi:hypothetical protein C8F04DRAFT_1198992 [Mycena alexandri]|uniref:Uncharacterized protein n=1 Tax=Mycena alexandri TaxID=1745969 RepID=A0AAD6WRN9_9AGAR|nr:hypothetical protein C8F04DRAFT_1198992 [Mycena alexandri]